MTLEPFKNMFYPIDTNHVFILIYSQQFFNSTNTNDHFPNYVRH